MKNLLLIILLLSSSPLRALKLEGKIEATVLGHTISQSFAGQKETVKLNGDLIVQSSIDFNHASGSHDLDCDNKLELRNSNNGELVRVNMQYKDGARDLNQGKSTLEWKIEADLDEGAHIGIIDCGFHHN
jgi:hypothetical protein